MSVILSVSLFVYHAIAADWAYNEPQNNVSHWKSFYEECGRSFQSPIDIPVDPSDCEDDLLLSWTSETVHFGIRNAGHSLLAVPFEVTGVAGTEFSHLAVLTHANDTNIVLQNLFYDTYESAVNSEYCFDSLHFHWGIDDDAGSEHTFDGVHSPLEVHLVHFSCDYDRLGHALGAYATGQTQGDDDNVLAVIGVLFEIGDPNPVLDEILSDVIVDGVTYHDPENPLDNVIQLFYTEFNPMDLLPENKQFIGYQGSLTTPPCYETVRWHVMKDKMTVSQEQMEQFRLLLSSTDLNDSMAPNWRPTQEIGNRTIYQCTETVEYDAVLKDIEDDDHWSYSNTSHWNNMEGYEACGGDHQSPIDIVAALNEDECEKGMLLNWTSEEVHFGVVNNGHSLVAHPFDVHHVGGTDYTRLEVMHHANDTNIRLQNTFYDTYKSNINSEYCFDSLHFHWGTDDDTGSEHTLNSAQYPLEVHLVHFSCDFSLLDEALTTYANDELGDVDDHHVLAVIGVLFEIGDANPVLDKLLSDVILENTRYFDPDSTEEGVLELFYTTFDLMDLLPDNKEFVGYKGSLTTPPCYETVRWHMMKNTMTVSLEQMEKFRSILGSHVNEGKYIAPNWRPVQEIGDRTIYKCAETVVADQVDKDMDDDYPDSDASDWSYSNTSHWKYLEGNEECGGDHQSPIDILTAQNDDGCEEEMLLDWTSEEVHFGVVNSGHSLIAVPFDMHHLGGTDFTRLEVLHHANDTKIRLQNHFYNTFKSNINSEYCFDSLHFHWGTDDDTGSEHTLNGAMYPLEVHFVHFSCDFPLLGDALDAYRFDELGDVDDHHVLAVIGVLFEIGDANPVLDKLLSDVILENTRSFDPDSAEEGVLELFYTEFDVMDLLPDNKEFVGYKGSLTTPPCYETVRWHMMKNTMTVSLEQMEKFRSILGSHANEGIAPNWRPVQELGDRARYQCNEEVEVQTVEKEEAYDRDTEEPPTDDADTWFIIGVVFICLFGVAALVICYMSYELYCSDEGRPQKKKKLRTNSAGAQYEKANQDEDDDNLRTDGYH